MRRVVLEYFKEVYALWEKVRNKELLTTKFVGELQEYLRGGKGMSETQRAFMPPGQRAELRDAERNSARVLGGQLEPLQCYEHHYQSAQRQHLAAAKDLAELQLGRFQAEH